MKGLQISLLGDVDISYDGNSIVQKLSEKSVAMIAMMVCTAKKKIARHKIASMLWADSFETANYNLRYNLWNIRKNIPKAAGDQEFILSDREYCWINPHYEFGCDIVSLERAREEYDARTISEIANRELLRGSFLERFYIKNGEEFNEWAEMQRASYERICLDVLRKMLDYDRRNGNLELAIRDLSAMLQLDPFNEDLHYSLMKTYIKNGNHSRAIVQYKRYKKLLMEELQVEPRECIKKLYASLMDQTQEPEQSPAPEDATVVVLNSKPAPRICYSAAGDLIDCILQQVNDGYLEKVPANYWTDIYTIHPDANRFAGGERRKQSINDIRLFYSIRGMLLKLSELLDFQVIIKNVEAIDDKSKELLGFLENTTELNLQYEE